MKIDKVTNEEAQALRELSLVLGRQRRRLAERLGKTTLKRFKAALGEQFLDIMCI